MMRVLPLYLKTVQGKMMARQFKGMMARQFKGMMVKLFKGDDG